MTNDEKRELIAEARHENDELEKNVLGVRLRVLDRLADALQGTLDESEWEYGCVHPDTWQRFSGTAIGVTILADTEGNMEWQRNRGYVIVRRRKAAPWEVVDDENV